MSVEHQGKLIPKLVFCIFDSSRSYKCQRMAHRGSDLHFSARERCGTSSDVSVDHLDVFAGEMPVHVFCPFLIDYSFCVCVQFYKFFIYFGS